MMNIQYLKQNATILLFNQTCMCFHLYNLNELFFHVLSEFVMRNVFIWLDVGMTVGLLFFK